MAVQKLALSLALAWFLLAGPFLMGEATGSPCKRQQARERKPTLETLHWQEAYLPLAVILGGCCGLVWWVLLIIYDVSQKGGQKGLPQISGKVELEERMTTTLAKHTKLPWRPIGSQEQAEPSHCRILAAQAHQMTPQQCRRNLGDYSAEELASSDEDPLEEWTEARSILDCKAAGERHVSPQVAFGPCSPCQPKEQGHPMFWIYLEQELERILLAVRCHRTTGQNPVPEETANTLAVEKLSHLVGDWQNFLAQIKPLPLTVQGQTSPAVDKQHPLPKEGQSPLAKDQHSPPAKDQHSPPSGQGQSSSAKERKESPNRARSRSKSKSKNQGCSPCRSRGCSPCRSQGCSSRRRGPCSKRK